MIYEPRIQNLLAQQGGTLRARTGLDFYVLIGLVQFSTEINAALFVHLELPLPCLKSALLYGHRVSPSGNINLGGSVANKTAMSAPGEVEETALSPIRNTLLFLSVFDVDPAKFSLIDVLL